ncbi:AraC-like DNA-binding protein [Flavobacterium sp. 9]|uniref:helix-turn-helix domain-containing protein n=1 Tax=Flavobacterium sp. 9 TaxID=2035198 RepID=UPI000C19640B|nr:helix-turn-helix domain-containing protein [Flavobacterium sp. 9]PIF34544.1 AraC-like DNA-binding protein [Flavobacterium sp. 9]
MIKDLINIELNDLPIKGLDIHVIKRYVVKTRPDESFIVNNFSILLIKSGRFKIQLKDIISDLAPHDLMVIPKNSFCTLLEVHGKLKLFLISFNSDFAFENCLKKELLDSCYFFISKSSLSIALDRKDFQLLSLIYKLIYFINKDAKRNGVEQELQRVSFNLFLYELKVIYAKYTSSSIMNFNRMESLTIQFLTILTIHCKKQHSVKFYAGSLFVTADYLNKMVKKVTGKTVKSLIADAIINEAKNQLNDNIHSIASIAEDFEFTTTSGFTSFFKRHTSMSPSEYRSKFIDNTSR